MKTQMNLMLILDCLNGIEVVPCLRCLTKVLVWFVGFAVMILIARAGNHKDISDTKEQLSNDLSLVLALRPRHQPARPNKARSILGAKEHLNDGTSLVLALRARRDSAI